MTFASLTTLLAALFVPNTGSETTVDPGHYQRVDVCFALDTTGSMSSLIETAKGRIWFIANEIVNAPSQPDVRFCLVAYRDRGDDYVTRHFDLTDDLDAIHRALLELEAGGGGDTPEAVNQALLQAIDETSWQHAGHVLRIIFLVGDAPPRENEEPNYRQISALAAERGILINPVLCGSNAQAEMAWDAIAAGAGGRMMQIDDPASRRDVWTPMDSDIAVLGARLDRSTIPYGPENERAAFDKERERLDELDDDVAADRVSFFSTTGGLTRREDLVVALENGAVDPGGLNPDWLPEPLHEMTTDELLAHVRAVREDRAEITALIAALVADRREYLRTRRDSDSFESRVSALVVRQLGSGR